MRLVDEVRGRIPDGYSVLHDESNQFYYPVRFSPSHDDDRTDFVLEHLVDHYTLSPARFWSLGAAVLFVHEYAADRESSTTH